MSSSFSYQEVLGGHRLLVIVPHADDETITAGSIIIGAVAEGMDVSVAYLTNSDWEYDVPLRNQEARAACEVLGVKQVYFLGYPDSGSEEISVYCHPQAKIPYQGRMLCYDGLLQDMEQIIKQVEPTVVIATGGDHHRDHKLCEKVLLDTMERLNAVPIHWYTSFAYATDYEGINDFYSRQFQSTKMNRLHVPQGQTTPSKLIDWDKRIRLPIPKLCQNLELVKHPLYLALAAHTSQAAYRRAVKVINGDALLWKRDKRPLSGEYIHILSDEQFVYHAESLKKVQVYHVKDGRITIESANHYKWFQNGREILPNGLKEARGIIRCECRNDPKVYCEVSVEPRSTLQYAWWCAKNYIAYKIDRRRRKPAYVEIRKQRKSI